MARRKSGYVDGSVDGELAGRQMERQLPCGKQMWPSPAVNLSPTKSSRSPPPPSAKHSPPRPGEPSGPSPLVSACTSVCSVCQLKIGPKT